MLARSDEDDRDRLVNSIPTSPIQGFYSGEPVIDSSITPSGRVMTLGCGWMTIAFSIVAAITLVIVIPIIGLYSLLRQIENEDMDLLEIVVHVLMLTSLVSIFAFMGMFFILAATKWGGNHRTVIEFDTQSIFFYALGFRGHYEIARYSFNEIAAIQCIESDMDSAAAYQVNMVFFGKPIKRIQLLRSNRIKRCEYVATEVANAVRCPIVGTLFKLK